MTIRIKAILLSTILCLLLFNARGNDCIDLQNTAEDYLNRQLTSEELALLGNCSADSTKINLVNYIVTQKEFIEKIILTLRLELLQGSTTDLLVESLQDFDLIMFTQPKNYDWAYEESKKLYKVYNLVDTYLDDSISIEHIYTILLNNWIYDQQNMGIDNYVNSTFLYLIGRKPTISEFNQSKNIVTKKSGFLFFQNGIDRIDYLYILTHNEGFIEKQIKYWHYYFFYEYPDDISLFKIISELKRNKESFKTIDIIKYFILKQA